MLKLAGPPGLDLAFIYRSIAAEEARPDSDVDRLRVGSNQPRSPWACLDGRDRAVNIRRMAKARSVAAIVLRSVLLFGFARCTEATGPSGLGPLIARQSLIAADGKQLPCCTTTSSDGSVTLVGGALSLYTYATYLDTVATPAGLRSGACVQEVPNGAHVALNGLVTLPDGSAYLLIPCSAGIYRFTLTRQLAHPDGSSDTTDILLTSGSFTWQRDRLTLVDSEGGTITASLSGATVAVAAASHHYELVATAIR